MSSPRRGFTRLWIALSSMWALIAGGLFIAQEFNRWNEAPVALPRNLVERILNGKTIDIENVGRVTFPKTMTDSEIVTRIRAEVSERIEASRKSGRSDAQILDGLVSAAADPKYEAGRVEWARREGYSDKEVIAFIAANNMGGEIWESYSTRLPDGSSAVISAPNQLAANEATRKYWDDTGGWLKHRWFYAAIALLFPIVGLYALGRTVAWIIAGFRQ